MHKDAENSVINVCELGKLKNSAISFATIFLLLWAKSNKMSISLYLKCWHHFTLFHVVFTLYNGHYPLYD